MAKLKSHRGVLRRIKVTGTGRLVRWRTGRRHLLTGKSGKRGRHVRRLADVPDVLAKKLRQLIPYR